LLPWQDPWPNEITVRCSHLGPTWGGLCFTGLVSLAQLSESLPSVSSATHSRQDCRRLPAFILVSRLTPRSLSFPSVEVVFLVCGHLAPALWSFPRRLGRPASIASNIVQAASSYRLFFDYLAPCHSSGELTRGNPRERPPFTTMTCFCHRNFLISLPNPVSGALHATPSALRCRVAHASRYSRTPHSLGSPPLR